MAGPEDRKGAFEAQDDHKCMGCNKQIDEFEPHIHVPLSEWAAHNGHAESAMPELDDLFTFAFCAACTEEGGHWHIESHDIERVEIPDTIPMEWTA